MTETEQFLATIGPRITEAEAALHNGDSGPRSAMWSRAEPRPYMLRVTTIFRREDGEWKVVHRHANAAADPGEVVGRLAPRAVI
jgi:hypothetical protein